MVSNCITGYSSVLLLLIGYLATQHDKQNYYCLRPKIYKSTSLIFGTEGVLNIINDSSKSSLCSRHCHHGFLRASSGRTVTVDSPWNNGFSTESPSFAEKKECRTRLSLNLSFLSLRKTLHLYRIDELPSVAETCCRYCHRMPVPFPFAQSTIISALEYGTRRKGISGSLIRCLHDQTHRS